MVGLRENDLCGTPDLYVLKITDRTVLSADVAIAMDPFMVGDIPVVPILVWHLKMPVLGFRFGRFTYITDANRIDASEREKIKGSEIVVLNALRMENLLVRTEGDPMTIARAVRHAAATPSSSRRRRPAP